MRVYELAKQLGMENRELIPELKRLGIPVASHSSALDDDSVRVAIEKLSSKARAGEASAGHEGKKAGRAKEHGATHALVRDALTDTLHRFVTLAPPAIWNTLFSE